MNGSKDKWKGNKQICLSSIWLAHLKHKGFLYSRDLKVTWVGRKDKLNWKKTWLMEISNKKLDWTIPNIWISLFSQAAERLWSCRIIHPRWRLQVNKHTLSSHLRQFDWSQTTCLRLDLTKHVTSTRFSDHCANTVIQTSSAPLYKVQVTQTENSLHETSYP